MPRIVRAGDWYQRAEQPGMDGCGGCPARVEMECEEADGDVQGFARDFVPVYERAPVPVNGDKTEGRGGSGYRPPIGEVCGSGGRRGEVAVGFGRRAI